MHLVEADVPAVIVRDILGHADLRTTGIYSRASMEMKRRALEQSGDFITPPALPPWKTNAGLMDWLRAL
jgi:hypothetical protein